MEPFKICLGQMASAPDVAKNLDKAERIVRAAAENGDRLVALPENVLLRDINAVRRRARSLRGWERIIGPISKRYDICVVWGGVPLREEGVLYNAALVVRPDGVVSRVYRKMHLFQFADGTSVLDETARYTPGRQPEIIAVDGWLIGLSICYDLRFPELYRCYLGVDLILCTSEFTWKTGRVHWATLLQARAIENQCYIAGVNQCGINRSVGIKAYGHSIVYGPWGETVVEAGAKATLLHAELTRPPLERVRSMVPVRNAVQGQIRWGR